MQFDDGWSKEVRVKMFNIWRNQTKNLPQVNKITEWTKNDEELYAPGALLQVKNGKGILCARMSREPREATYFTLMFGNKPLFQFQGDEYYCPTCEKILRSGYQLEQTEEFHNDVLNEENVPFSQALEAIEPLLGLLSDNYYVVLDTELYPTDGNGHLFWNVPNDESAMHGSCMYYHGSGEWGFLRPHFTVATQSIEKLDRERVEYYREHPNSRAIAYYMDGYMTALIDGHHKAMAAALNHTMVKTLVIVPCDVWKIRDQKEGLKMYAAAGDMRFDFEQYELEEISSHYNNYISDEQVKDIQKQIPTSIIPCPYDNDTLVRFYPDVESVYYMDLIGTVSDTKLNDIISRKHICTTEEIVTLLKALGGMRHERLFEMADFFLYNCSYTSRWKCHDVEVYITIVEQLFKLPRTTELEQYLIDVMVEFEDEYPTVRERILEYL